MDDANDAFPLDGTESVDTDGDGVGNNSDSDDDNDTVEDVNDAFPLDPNESADTDGDGIGDNADTTPNGDPSGGTATLVSVNDWGSGFNATFEYVIEEADTQNNQVTEWLLSVGYTGAATLNSAWMSGYGGGVSTNNTTAFTITNAGQGYQPPLAVGDTLTFTVNGSGGGYVESDFSPTFTNLDEEPVPPSTEQSSATVTNVNDWGSGFQVQFTCEIPESITTLNSFEIDIDYSGAGSLGNSWMNGYNGGVQSGNVASDGGYGILSNVYVPPMSGGDTLGFTVQGQGSSYTASDFEVQCVVEGQ